MPCSRLSSCLTNLTAYLSRISPAICVMERKVDADESKVKASMSSKVACSTSLPKYQIDSSSKKGISDFNSGEICFNNVRFAYPSRPESSVLEGFTLSLKPGQTIGVVGPSGSGVRKFCLSALSLRYVLSACLYSKYLFRKVQ